MTPTLLYLPLSLHIMAATGLIHELEPITLELEDLNAVVIILERSFLSCQLPIRIAARRFHLLAFLAEGFELTVEAFDLTPERIMF
jgi:hypothetical protein